MGKCYVSGKHDQGQCGWAGLYWGKAGQRACKDGQGARPGRSRNCVFYAHGSFQRLLNWGGDGILVMCLRELLWLLGREQAGGDKGPEEK